MEEINTYVILDEWNNDLGTKTIWIFFLPLFDGWGDRFEEYSSILKMLPLPSFRFLENLNKSYGI